MSCPEAPKVGIPMLGGLFCLSTTDQSEWQTGCCSYFEAYQECPEIYYSMFAQGETQCDLSLSGFNASGLCYLTVGTLSQQVCSPIELNENIVRGMVHPEYGWAQIMITCLAIGLVLLSYLSHTFSRRNLQFQALYLCFLTMIALAVFLQLISTYFPMVYPALTVALAFIEGYLAFLFGGFMVLWGDQQGSVEDALMNSSGCSPYNLLCYKRGTKFKHGWKAVIHWKRMVFQFWVIKVLTALGQMSLNYVTDTFDIKRGFQLLFGIANLVSIVLMLRGLSKIYLGLKQAKLLEGSGAFFKFFIVKIVFTCLVVNNLLISNLLKSDVISAPGWICQEQDGSTAPDAECRFRFMDFIFMCEATILLFLGVFSFSYRDFPAKDAPAYGICELPKAMFQTNPFTLWSTRSIRESSDQIKSTKSAHFQQKAHRYRQLVRICCVLGLIFLILGYYTPFWYQSEVDGCFISISYMAPSWCHGSCPTSLPYATKMDALATKSTTQELLLYGVCQSSIDQATPGWAMGGIFVGFVALLCVVLAFVFKNQHLILFGGLISYVPFILMNIYAVDAFNDNLAIVSLIEVYGATTATAQFAYGALLVGATFCVIGAFVVYRFHHYTNLAVLMEEPEDDIEDEEGRVQEAEIIEPENSEAIKVDDYDNITKV